MTVCWPLPAPPCRLSHQIALPRIRMSDVQHTIRSSSHTACVSAQREAQHDGTSSYRSSRFDSYLDGRLCACEAFLTIRQIHINLSGASSNYRPSYSTLFKLNCSCDLGFSEPKRFDLFSKYAQGHTGSQRDIRQIIPHRVSLIHVLIKAAEASPWRGMQRIKAG